MTTLPNMGLVLPTRGAPGAGQWGDTDDANSAKVDAHDHSTGKGTPVKTNGISLDADLTFSSLYAPINLHRITFASIVALTSNNKSLFVNTADNELYWRSNAGANVRLTNGSALNVAAFTGGIGGDYTAVSAAVAFDDAGDRYTFKQNGGTGWARLASGDVRLFETGTSDTVFVGLAAPAALAASYTVTMPLAAPTAGTRPVQMTTAGVLTAGDTDAMRVGGLITGDAGLATTAIVASGVITGNAGVATTAITASGVITASAGIAVGSNQHVVLAGTGRLKHGTRELNLAISAYAVDGASTYVTFNQVGYISGFGGVCSCQAPVFLDVGKRILSLQQFYDVAGTGSGIQFFLKRINHSTGTVTTVSSSSSDNTGTGIESQTLSAINHTVLTGEAYWVQVNVATANHRVYGCTITYDEP